MMRPLIVVAVGVALASLLIAGIGMVIADLSAPAVSCAEFTVDGACLGLAG